MERSGVFTHRADSWRSKIGENSGSMRGWELAPQGRGRRTETRPRVKTRTEGHHPWQLVESIK